MNTRARKRFERKITEQATALYREAFNALVIALKYGSGPTHGPVISHHPVTPPAYRAALTLLQEAGVIGEQQPATSKWALRHCPILGVLPVHEDALLRALDTDSLALYRELERLSFQKALHLHR